MIFGIFLLKCHIEAKLKLTEFTLNIHRNLFLIKSDQLSTSLSDQKVTDCEDRQFYRSDKHFGHSQNSRVFDILKFPFEWILN